MDADLMDLMHGIQELADARADYDRAQAYYEGEVPEVFASSRIRRALRANDIDFDLNFAKTAVNAVVDRLEVAAITSPDNAVNTLIAKLWDDNNLALELPDLHRRGCEYGDAYLICLPVEDDKGTVLRVEMFYNSPQTVRIIYSQENPRLKEFAIKRWVDGCYRRVELYYPDRIERWTTKKNTSGKDEADWEHWLAGPDEDTGEVDPDSWLIEHDWGEIPVFHYRTDRPYGVPEHFGAYGPQNAINKLQSTHMGTVDYQGFPQRYALTEAATTDTGDLEPGDWDDADFPPDDRDQGPSDSGDDSSLKAGPGELMLLRGFKAVGQFDAAQPSVFLDPIIFNVRAMAQITTTPTWMFDPSGEQPSGQSVRGQDAGFTRKICNRQLSFGSTHREAFVFSLRQLGVEEPVVDVRWVPAETVDTQEGWQTVGEKIKNGVPRKQALMEAGYRAEQVDEWLEGVDDAELSRRVGILAAVADSAQKLGAAAALGVVTSEQVQQLLAGALSDIELLAGIEAKT
ncbi:phage portal protein [Streptomyces sp. NEAU-174]|uniref:phage portal protein n=1 Tax=Streptomyces sp. NEAU-174 TaxID=3458254 RepID=UPI004043D7D5